MKNKIVFIIGGMAAFIILVTILGRGSRDDTNVSQANQDANQNLSSNQSEEFKKVFLSELVNEKIDRGTSVEVQGKVTQKDKFTYLDPSLKVNDTKYYIKIEDNGYANLIEVDKEIIGTLKIGDVISVKGVNGNMGCGINDKYSNGSHDLNTQKMCSKVNSTFNLSQSSVPVIIVLGTSEKDSIIIIQKGTSSNANNSTQETTYTAVPSANSNQVTQPQPPPNASQGAVTLEELHAHWDNYFHQQVITQGQITRLIPFVPNSLFDSNMVLISDNGYVGNIENINSETFATLSLGDTIEAHGFIPGGGQPQKPSEPIFVDVGNGSIKLLNHGVR